MAVRVVLQLLAPLLLLGVGSSSAVPALAPQDCGYGREIVVQANLVHGSAIEAAAHCGGEKVVSCVDAVADGVPCVARALLWSSEPYSCRIAIERGEPRASGGFACGVAPPGRLQRSSSAPSRDMGPAMIASCAPMGAVESLGGAVSLGQGWTNLKWDRLNWRCGTPRT